MRVSICKSPALPSSLLVCLGMQCASAATALVLIPFSRSIALRSFIKRSCMQKPSKIAPAKGKLGVLLPGLGAVSTTFMAGVELVRKGKALPVGSLTQMGTIRLGKRTEGRTPLINKFVPLAELKDLAFGGWD